MRMYFTEDYTYYMKRMIIYYISSLARTAVIKINIDIQFIYINIWYLRYRELYHCHAISVYATFTAVLTFPSFNFRCFNFLFFFCMRNEWLTFTLFLHIYIYLVYVYLVPIIGNQYKIIVQVTLSSIDVYSDLLNQPTIRIHYKYLMIDDLIFFFQ